MRHIACFAAILGILVSTSNACMEPTGSYPRASAAAIGRSAYSSRLTKLFGFGSVHTSNMRSCSTCFRRSTSSNTHFRARTTATEHLLETFASTSFQRVNKRASSDRGLTLRSSRPRAVRWPGASAPRASWVQLSVWPARGGTRSAERKNVGRKLRRSKNPQTGEFDTPR